MWHLIQVPWRFTTSTFWVEKKTSWGSERWSNLSGCAVNLCMLVRELCSVSGPFCKPTALQGDPTSMGGKAEAQRDLENVQGLRAKEWQLELSPSDPPEGCKSKLTMLFPWNLVSGHSVANLHFLAHLCEQWWSDGSRSQGKLFGGKGLLDESRMPQVFHLFRFLLQAPSGRSQECFSPVNWSHHFSGSEVMEKAAAQAGSSSLASPLLPRPLLVNRS